MSSKNSTQRAQSLPRVVGTLSDLAVLDLNSELPCDIVELRLDLLESPAKGLDVGKDLRSRGVPSLATLRLGAEGGKWNKPDRERVPILHEAVNSVAGVDVELQSEICSEVGAMARDLGKECIVSYHDFQKTAPREELERLIEKATPHATIVKISTMINSPDDLQTLRVLLASEWEKPLCVIGMGPLGAISRTQFLLLGSCLSYGFLDHAVAPGQVSASEVVEYLKSHLPHYAEEFSRRKCRVRL
jgi:3-dehydroquinate dehydratase I